MKNSIVRKQFCEAEYDDDVCIDKIPTPVKLSQKDVDKKIVTIAGYKFIDTGYDIACPTCGLVSGISCREDVDKKIDWFLKFGCEHYAKK